MTPFAARMWGCLLSAAVACSTAAAAAQEGATAKDQPAAKDQPDAKEVDPATISYRFKETHGLPEGQDLAKMAPTYRVATRERITVKTPSAARQPATPQSSTRTAFWIERIAGVDPYTKDVSAVVRRYEAAPVRAGSGPKPAPSPLIGLTCWVQPTVQGMPAVLSLTADRGLSEEDFQAIRTQPFITSMPLLLPQIPQRAGESELKGLQAAEALLRVPVKACDLEVTLSKVGPLIADRPDDRRRRAEFTARGKAERFNGPAIAFQATIDFDFTPTAPVVRGSDLDLMVASGTITWVRLSSSEVVPGPGGVRTVMERQLTMQRDFAAVDPPLDLPNPQPIATIENSWIRLSGPNKAWSLLHPPEFIVTRNPETDGIDLVRERDGGPDVISLKASPGARLDPGTMAQKRQERWRSERQEFQSKPVESILDESWKGFLSAQRFGATLTPARRDEQAGVPPVQFIGYVLGFERPQVGSVYVEAMTLQADLGPFQGEVESVLRTFRFSAPGTGGTTPRSPARSAPSGSTARPARPPGSAPSRP